METRVVKELVLGLRAGREKRSYGKPWGKQQGKLSIGHLRVFFEPIFFLEISFTHLPNFKLLSIC